MAPLSKKRLFSRPSETDPYECNHYIPFNALTHAPAGLYISCNLVKFLSIWNFRIFHRRNFKHLSNFLPRFNISSYTVECISVLRSDSVMSMLGPTCPPVLVLVLCSD